MTAKITLVMPCYNGIKFIRQAVDSVVSQSLRDWELLISDDGSSDGTKEYLRSLADDRIKIFFQARNLGIFGNLNFLFARAEAPITQILCQDDFLIDDHALAKIQTIWDGLPPSVAFLRCNHGHDGGSKLMLLEREILPSLIQPERSDLYFFIFGCIPGNLSNVSVRTPIVAKMGWYRIDLPYAGDFEFWARVGRTHPWAISTSYVIKIRRHAEQASKTLNKRGELLPQLRVVLEELSTKLRARGYSAVELRVFATGVYSVQHMHGAIMGGLRRGDWTYLKLVNRLLCGGDCFLGRPLSWVVYGATAGGRLLGRSMARRLLRARAA
jgi:glycosyltransferase involved in cell wall biosynthesis